MKNVEISKIFQALKGYGEIYIFSKIDIDDLQIQLGAHLDQNKNFMNSIGGEINPLTPTGHSSGHQYHGVQIMPYLKNGSKLVMK